jgi:hypothetical protein
VLLVAGRSASDILDAASEVASAAGLATVLQGVCVAVPGGGEGRLGLSARLDSVRRALADAARSAAPPVNALPVYELPSGRLVGWWAPQRLPVAPAEGFSAVPVGRSDSGLSWSLRLAPGHSELVHDVTDSAAIDEGAQIVRLPGQLATSLRRGSPAGLLVERMARAAARRGATLWVPHVDGEGLQLLLRLGARLWVDGPAVPEHAFPTAD